GKSSLAFDTLYAEGQRRYVESLSAYARQFLEQMEKPDCDAIEGLSPAIAIEQKGTGRNPRSTVGTVTEIADYLRLLYARVGHPYCFVCGREIAAQTVQQAVDRRAGLPADTRLFLYAPVVRDRKGEHRRELEELRRGGFVRVRVDGTVRELTEEIPLARAARHTIEVLVDRLVVRPGVDRRLADSLAVAFRPGSGTGLGEASGPGGGAPRAPLFTERPARPPSVGLPIPSSRRASSPSTARTGRVRIAAGSGCSAASTRPVSCRTPTSHCPQLWRRPRCGPFPTWRRRSGRSPPGTASGPRRRSPTSPRRCSRWCWRARERRSSTSWRCAQEGGRPAGSRSRVSSRSSSGASARPARSGCARSWKGWWPTVDVRRARGRGSVAKRASCGWGGRAWSRSRHCPSARRCASSRAPALPPRRPRSLAPSRRKSTPVSASPA